MPYKYNSQAYQMWGRLSTQWAKGASGEVNVFLNGTPHPESIWLNYELPTLLKNPNVTNIIYH
ncbi:MAG: hypothetical protein M3004_02815 [Bacteroidota bacterium]|nr:hypothetical protein [Bacteroidota bacterium]